MPIAFLKRNTIPAGPPGARRLTILPAASSRPLLGIALMVGATLVLPCIDAIAKYLGDELAPLQITWGRFLFQFVCMAGLWFATRWLPLPDAGTLRVRRPGLQLLRGVLLAIATLLFFWSLRYLPIATAIALFFIQPMLLTLFSAWFLRESIGWHRRAAVCCGFAGVLLILQPGSAAFTPAALLPVGAAFFFAAYLTLTRATATGDSPVAMQFASGLGAFVLLSAALVSIAVLDPQNRYGWAPVWLNPVQWLWLALLGLIAAVCHLMVVYATRLAAASLLAPFGYTEIIAATLLGWWIFHDWPDPLTWAGIAVIVGSGLYVWFREAFVHARSNSPSGS